MILPVVLAGGSGSRLWPLSRQSYPKQFLKLESEFSLLQNTINRIAGEQFLPAIVICNEVHRFIVAEQLREINYTPNSIILEPEGRNTAPAIAIAAHKALQAYENVTLLVLSSDHHIADTASFHLAVTQAERFTEQARIVALACEPSSAHTGYGYIEQGEHINEDTFKIASFTEKPDLATAKSYLKSGKYFWNCGIFLFDAQQFLSILTQFKPNITVNTAVSLQHANADLDFIRLEQESFKRCEDISIDYAIMEKINDAVSIRLNTQWNDLGAWHSLWQVGKKDADHNVTQGDVITHNAHQNFIHSDSALVCAIDVDELVIVQTKDALLVAPNNASENIKSLIEKLKKQKRSELSTHKAHYRPWGKFDSISQGERFQVKHITVNPQGKLSTQLHHHRAEHWVVVAGTAHVQINDQFFTLTENQSTYIPIGAIHSLENRTNQPLEIVEVQSGDYLGEDDIVRLKDKYRRD